MGLLVVPFRGKKARAFRVHSRVLSQKKKRKKEDNALFEDRYLLGAEKIEASPTKLDLGTS